MAQAVDSSVALAALLADHDAHAQAGQALAASTITIAHVAIESYSVLTRLPRPLQLDAAQAALILDARLPDELAALSRDAYASAPTRLARAGVIGGATYDGVIALTALEHDVELLSRDRRAARTYRALGVRFDLLGS